MVLSLTMVQFSRSNQGGADFVNLFSILFCFPILSLLVYGNSAAIEHDDFRNKIRFFELVQHFVELMSQSMLSK